MKLAVFRADGSFEIGGGHIMRCLTLARALGKDRWRCGFAVGDKTLSAVPVLEQSGHDILVLNGEGDEAMEIAGKWRHADLLVVDHYGKDSTFETACRSFARRILVIDDLADRSHDCDILVDQSPGRDAGEYENLTPVRCQALIGPAYALIRPEYQIARNATLDTCPNRAGLQRILVNFGAADPFNLTALTLGGIARSGLESDVDVVLGSGASHLDQIKRLADEMSGQVSVHEWVDDMAALAARADLAIGAIGVTALERACLGLPSLVIIAADNQMPNARGLENSGAVINLGWHEEITEQSIADALISKNTSFADMSTRAAVLCDGLGARRISMVVDPAHAKGGTSIRLRPATPDDLQVTFDWQQHSDVRKYFRNPQPPTRDEHQAWFQSRLNDPRSLFNVVLSDERPVGVLRLDKSETDDAFEVSILVAPDAQRIGIGKAALDLAKRLLPENDLKAEVLPDNQTSVFLFENSGFVRDGRNFSFHPNDTPDPLHAAL